MHQTANSGALSDKGSLVSDNPFTGPRRWTIDGAMSEKHCALSLSGRQVLTERQKRWWMIMTRQCGYVKERQTERILVKEYDRRTSEDIIQYCI